MDKKELIDLVDRIKECDGTEEEIDELIDLLEKNVPDPNVGDLIFYRELSSEEIVDIALSYIPIQL